MAECAFRHHDFKGDVQRGEGFEQITMRCRICGVGHTLLINWTGSNAATVDVTVFPPSGQRTVNRDVVRWAVLASEETVRDMERNGVSVVRGETSILGEPIGA